jgi:pimeloyl-ACP methyl ester carboxylesterase
MYFNFRNTAIHYKTFGKGKVVVMLHGFLESSEMWDDYAESLSENFQVVLIDLPGHGESGFFSTGTTIDLMAEMVNALLDDLNIKKVQMVGHSMGGYVILAFAELFKRKLKSFILLNSTAFEDPEENLEKREKAIEMLESHPELYIKQTIPGLFREETLFHFSNEKHKLISSALKVNAPYNGYIESVKAMRDRPDRIHMLRTHVPKLFIAGSYDPVIPENTSFRQMHFLRHGDDIFLEESGHMGFIEEKETTLQLIKQFLINQNKI